MRPWLACVGAVGALAVAGATFAQETTLTWVRELPGVPFATGAVVDVSADGQTICGTYPAGDGSPVDRAYRWSAGVFTALGEPGGLSVGGSVYATAISPDGSVVVGFFHHVNGGTHAFRWSAGVIQDIGGIEARGIGADGTIAGSCLGPSGNPQACRWQAGTITLLAVAGDPADSLGSLGLAMSADGAHIAGVLAETDVGAVWTGGQLLEIPAPPPCGLDSRGLALNADGSVIAGVVHVCASFPWNVARWTSGAWQDLGVPAVNVQPGTLVLDASGALLAGSGMYPNGQGWIRRSFIWDQLHGARMVDDYLRNDLGLDITGWSGATITGFSADGLTIVGGIGRAACQDVDGFVLRLGTRPRCRADWNVDGAVNPADVAGFVVDWFSSLGDPSARANMDRDCAVAPADVAAFVNAWWAALNGGCS